MTGTRRKVVIVFLVAPLLAGLLAYAVVSVSKGEHPGAAANKACAQHGGIDRPISSPSGGSFTVICRDHVAVDVSY